MAIWDAYSYRLIRRISDQQAPTQDVAWHPEGSHIATPSLSGTVKIHEISSGHCLQTLRHDGFVHTVAYHPSGTCLATGSQDSHIRLWNPEQGNCLATLKGHRDSIWSLSWDADGLYLASGSHDGTIRLWDKQSCVAVFDSQSGVWSLAWSPDGTKLISGYQDGSARIWEVATGNCLTVLTGHAKWVRAVVWMRDGSAIATGSADGTIKLWEPETGQCLKTLRAKRFYEGTNISQTTGISPAQRASLIALGAIDHSSND